MKKRVFAILNWYKDRFDNVQKEIIEKLPLREKNDKIIVFYRSNDYQHYIDSDNELLEYVPISEEDGHNRAAGLNFVYKYLKEHFVEHYGYTIYDSVQFKKDPKEFLDKFEEFVEKMHLDIWFNTYMDPMNFVFNKFDPRVSITINEPEYQAIYDKTILWTSHSNPNFTFVDIDRFDFKNGKPFDDRFNIPMFWIIKFLCERARDKVGFMNHYPTIEEEIGVYKTSEFNGAKFTQEQMKKEDIMFGELKLDHTPHQSVEELMEFMMKRLKNVTSMPS